MKPIVIIVIAFVLLIPIPVFAVDITIIEVEPNPAGNDAGNEWIRLFNPFGNSVDLTGWKISSTHGKTNTYTISENIGSCDNLKIVFPNQFLDNSGESLILYDKSGNVVDSTPIINDGSNDGTTWQTQSESCVSVQKEPVIEEPVIEEPVIEEPVIEEPVIEEPEYLDNGCPAGYPYIWEDGLCYTSQERVYKESEMGFYSNEKFDFSLEAPVNWSYQESVAIVEGRIDEVVLFPSEFHISNAGDDANMMDMQTAMMGWQWQFESPNIGMDYENIPTSKIKNMNENNIKDYYLDFVRETIPSAKMTDIYSKSHNYGWEVGVTYYFDVDLGLGQSIPYVGIDKAFFFKDREKYTLYYGSPEVYFDEYKPVYDHAVDTLTIKSVAVPEFGSIVMLILVSAIIPIILVSRKFEIVK